MAAELAETCLTAGGENLIGEPASVAAFIEAVAVKIDTLKFGLNRP